MCRWIVARSYVHDGTLHKLESCRRLPEVWPSDGAIDVQSLVVRYRPELDPVLNSISFSVKGAHSHSFSSQS